MKTISKINLFGSEDFDYLESWLYDMNKQGLALKEAGPLFCEFVKDNSKDLRYRIIPVSYNKMPEEEIQLYKSTGWNYINTTGSMSAFCSDDPSSPEPFTDASTWKSKFRREFIFNLITIPLIIAMYVYLFSDICGNSLSLFLNGHVVVSEVFFLITNVSILGLLFIKLVSNIRFTKLLNNYEKVDHLIEYKWKRILLIGLLFAIIISFFAMIICSVVGI